MNSELGLSQGAGKTRCEDYVGPAPYGDGAFRVQLLVCGCNALACSCAPVFQVLSSERRHSFRRLSTGAVDSIRGSPGKKKTCRTSVCVCVCVRVCVCVCVCRAAGLTVWQGSTSEDLEAAFNARKPNSRKCSKEAGGGNLALFSSS